MMDEQKKNRWKLVDPWPGDYTDCFECPDCGEYVYLPTFENSCKYDYCPFCGQRIIEEEKQ